VAAEARSFGVAPEGSGHKASSAEAGVARASYAHAAACASAALAALAGVFKRRGFFVAKHAEQRPAQMLAPTPEQHPQRIKALRAAQKRLPQRKKRKKKRVAKTSKRRLTTRQAPRRRLPWATRGFAASSSAAPSPAGRWSRAQCPKFLPSAKHTRTHVHKKKK
jgi:hypothetical protein